MNRNMTIWAITCVVVAGLVSIFSGGCVVESILPIDRGDNDNSQACITWHPGSNMGEQFTGFEVCGSDD